MTSHITKAEMSSIYLKPSDLQGIAKKRVKYDKLRRELFKSDYSSQSYEASGNFDVSMDENYLHGPDWNKTTKNIFKGSYRDGRVLSVPQQSKLVAQVNRRPSGEQSRVATQYNRSRLDYGKKCFETNRNDAPYGREISRESFQGESEFNDRRITKQPEEHNRDYAYEYQDEDVIQSRLRSNIKKRLQGPSPPDVSVYDKHTLDCRFQPIINLGEIINILHVSHELRTVDFFGCSALTDDDMLQIVPELCSKHVLSSVEAIDLGSTQLTERSLAYFFQKLNNIHKYDRKDMYIRGLKYLYLNKLNCSYIKISAYIHTLMSNAYFEIEELYLKNNEIDDHMALQLLQSITAHKPLNVLNLQNNQITNEFLREYEVMVHVNGFIPVKTLRLELNQINQQLLESFYYRIERLQCANQDVHQVENKQRNDVQPNVQKQLQTKMQFLQEMQSVQHNNNNRYVNFNAETTQFLNDYKSVSEVVDDQLFQANKKQNSQSEQGIQQINQQQTIQALINASDITDQHDSKQQEGNNIFIQPDNNYIQQKSVNQNMKPKINGYKFIEQQLQEQKQMENMIIIPDIKYTVQDQIPEIRPQQEDTKKQKLDATQDQSQTVQITQVQNLTKTQVRNHKQEQDLQESQVDVQTIPFTKFKRDLIAKLNAIAKEDNIYGNIQPENNNMKNSNNYKDLQEDQQTLSKESQQVSESTILKNKIKQTLRKNEQATAELENILQRSMAATNCQTMQQEQKDEKHIVIPTFLADNSNQNDQNQQNVLNNNEFQRQTDLIKQMQLLTSANDGVGVLLKIQELKEQLQEQLEEKRLFKEGVQNIKLLFNDVFNQQSLQQSDDPQSDIIDLVMQLYNKFVAKQ